MTCVCSQKILAIFYLFTEFFLTYLFKIVPSNCILQYFTTVLSNLILLVYKINQYKNYFFYYFRLLLHGQVSISDVIIQDVGLFFKNLFNRQTENHISQDVLLLAQ